MGAGLRNTYIASSAQLGVSAIGLLGQNLTPAGTTNNTETILAQVTVLGGHASNQMIINVVVGFDSGVTASCPFRIRIGTNGTTADREAFIVSVGASSTVLQHFQFIAVPTTDYTISNNNVISITSQPGGVGYNVSSFYSMVVLGS